MILLSEDVRAWGHAVTIHYTHPARAVVTQTSLTSRMDFTDVSPDNGIIRAVAFFTEYMSDGAVVDLMAAPHLAPACFRADQVTEFRGQLIADNCGARALVSQFGWTGPLSGPMPAATVHVITFHRPANGTIAFKHVAKAFAEGRVIELDEAVSRAKSDAERLGIDFGSMEMLVADDVALAAAAQRVDLQNGTLRASAL